MSLSRQDVLEMDRCELTNFLDAEGIPYDHHETLEGMQELYLERMYAASSNCFEECPMSLMPYTQEDINNMDMIELSELLDGKGIRYDHLESLQEMQELYWERMHATSSELCEDYTHQRVMEDIMENDQTMREELSHFYDTLMKLSKKSCFKAIMHGEIDNTSLTTSKDELSDKCPIVVAGETSAGKSSLLNLILGTDVLAHSLLGTTSIICRLHNSDTKCFEIHYDNDETIKVNRTDTMRDSEQAWKNALKPFLTERDARRNCKHVDIYWPVPMLQKHVIIVDTPGIGENDSLTDVLLSYLPKAVAFIYVINSANAGGIQDDYLLKILNQQKREAMKSQSTGMDYESTIFVLNKWDMVQQEEDIVWKNTLERIFENLPGFPVEQIFRMSVAEENRRRKGGLRLTSKFNELLKGIEKLIALSMKLKIRRHYRHIEDILLGIQSKLLARINHANKKKDDSSKLLKNVLKRIDRLRMDADKVKIKLLNAAQQECCEMSDILYAYLQKDDVREYVLSWEDSERSNVAAKDFLVIKFEAERKIQSRIRDVFKGWEKRNQIVKGASERLREMFLSEYQLLGEECFHINLLIEGEEIPPGEESASSLQTEMKIWSQFTSIEKAFIAVTSPLWFPLVTTATILLLPVLTVAGIKDFVDERRRHNSFINDKSKYMRKWAQRQIDNIFTKSYLREYIFETYSDPFVRHIDRMYSDVIPNKIAADRALICDIWRDKRSSMNVVEELTPILNEIRVILGKLRLYRINFLDQKTTLTKRQLIYKGKFCEVFKSRWRSFDNTELNVAIKVLNCVPYENITESTLKLLDEIEFLRKLRHSNIVEVYSICCSKNEENEDKKLTIVLELCEGILEDIVFTNESLQCWKFSTTDKHDAFEFYLKMAIGVCNGLIEIHQHRYCHRNLKLSNVLVKNQTAKLCGLTFPRSEESVYVKSSTHTSPEFLRTERNTSVHDIYSLGILLWELWYGQNVFTEDVYDRCSDTPKTSKSGKHPKLTYDYGPTTDLQALIKECSDNDPTKRPNAFDAVCRLRAFC